MIALSFIALAVFCIVLAFQNSFLRADLEEFKKLCDARDTTRHRDHTYTVSNLNKLYSYQTDFVKIFGERCTKAETKIEQRYTEALDAIAELEEDLTVALMEKK